MTQDHGEKQRMQIVTLTLDTHVDNVNNFIHNRRRGQHDNRRRQDFFFSNDPKNIGKLRI